MRLRVQGGKVLSPGGFIDVDLTLEADGDDGRIAGFDAATACDRALDASGLLVLPGLVDVHGDAFERQIEPRPGVGMDLAVALLETDRQLLGNGITTAFHGVTWSWEPGLRGPENARALMAAIGRLRPRLGADTRFHLRHETFNLDAEAEVLDWLAGRRVACLAFNDHINGTIVDRHRPDKIAGMVKRSGLSEQAFQALIDRTYARREEVPGSIVRLAAAARSAGVPVLSHDDRSLDERQWFRELGARICEFPLTAEIAEAAVAGGDATVFGAPNVLRGGSHTGCPAAAEMVGAGLCSILASDYYYPALLLAPFRLAELGVVPLEQAWTLVSGNPASAMGLDDRGVIEAGRRADLILVDTASDAPPRVVATIAAGMLRYLADGARLVHPPS
jgi:alpha-D-ribose 1-methylphosphonate 5-triphosphate diphosphatase